MRSRLSIKIPSMNVPIKSGIGPTRHDHRDLDFFKTFGTHLFGATGVQPLPDSFSVDAGLWMPNQNEANGLFNPIVPPLPEGCTDYGTTDLLINEDKILYNPMDIENITHANANGGGDIRVALSAGIKLHPNHPKYFNVNPDMLDDVDWFDAVRLAMIVGKVEGRAVTLGTPWFPEFMNAINGIIPTPNWSLTVPGTSLSRVSWHNWNSPGWTSFSGIPYLLGKPWIGPGYGDKGFGYFSRSVFNTLMNIPGVAAFTLEKLLPGQVSQTVESSIIQLVVSLFWEAYGRFNRTPPGKV